MSTTALCKLPHPVSVVVIDVGNTSTSIGHWDGERVTAITPVKGGIADLTAAGDALEKAGARTADAAILASVVPASNEKWAWILRQLYGKTLEILDIRTMKLPIGVRYPNPLQIGADRLCDATGAVARHGKPVAVADFGTALTFDVVDQDGAYTGGIIAPGLPLMTGYLHEKTAQLPKVDLTGVLPAWGDSTENAMKLGAKLGHRGMVREIISFIREQNQAETFFCATGGYAAWALEGIEECSIEPDLTLFGLGVIWNTNHPDGK